VGCRMSAESYSPHIAATTGRSAFADTLPPGGPLP
jgi:hypothetical protein